MTHFLADTLCSLHIMITSRATVIAIELGQSRFNNHQQADEFGLALPANAVDRAQGIILLTLPGSAL